ncbi:hypothetical protein BDZ97DRAFT_1783238 [Flammula alnicola]|nr:hypothetical protein BDZ97DRAFT_1783238 [Flammula alnicola]
MLRWCQSTLRTLDGHGRNHTSTIRYYSSPSRVAAVANLVPLQMRSSTSDKHSKNGKRVVKQVLGTRTEPNHRARRFTRRPSESGSVSLKENTSQTTSGFHMISEGEDNTAFPSPPPDALKHVHNLGTVAFQDPLITDSSVPPSISSSVGTRNAPTIIAAITQFLSPNATHESNEGRSIDALISLYKEASKQSILHQLDGEQLSAILSLGGTLSFASTRTSCVYDSLLVSYVHQASLNPGIMDKEKLGLGLNQRDRYWIMRASLARAERAPGQKSRPVGWRDLLSYAREYDEPDVHIPYLRFLLSTNHNGHLQEAVHHLCEILQRRADPHPQFPEMLWEILVRRGIHLSLDTKERICLLAFHRIGNDPASRRTSFGPITVPSLTPSIVRCGVLRTPHLATAFASTLFPCYNCHYPAHLLLHWAANQARQALAPTIRLDIRWNNLILLAVSMSPESVPVNYQPTTTVSPDSGNSLWRTALMLESFNRRIPPEGPDYGRLSETVRSIARPMWRMFATATHADQPVDINRAYVTMFLHIAAKECFRFSVQFGLWRYGQDDTCATKAQAVDAIAAYASALVSCGRQDWPQIYSTIAAALPDIPWQADVTNALLQHYASENVDIAFGLYLHSRWNDVAVSSRALSTTSLSLVKHERWNLVAPFLDDSAFSRDHIELVFGACLRVFQVQRYEYADASFVKLLASTASKLYNTSAVVKLVSLMHKIAPDLFTMRAHGNPWSRSLDDIRRKLAFKFSIRAPTKWLATFTGRTRAKYVTLGRDALVHAVSCRRNPSAPLYYADIQPIVSRAKTHPPTIRHAISVLVKARRVYAARKLYAGPRQLRSQDQTVIGNIILHAAMAGSDLRNGRLVRHILRTKDLLSKDYGFLPDRATVNIILKAMLRWRPMIDSKQVKRLFDQMAHEGSIQFPRGRSSNGLSIPSLSVHISFAKHVRPMYKMFIKAFYLHNDIPAAKMLWEREKRNRARRQGMKEHPDVGP